MTLQPDAIDLEGLPRTIGGGLKREPVEELLKRVQWEYSQLYYEHKRLKEKWEQGAGAKSGLLDQQKRALPASPAPERDGGPVARIERTLRAEPLEIARTAPVPPKSAEPIPAQPVEHVPQRELDDLARLVLASAHRASIELRESARRDCELMLKKTRERLADRERNLEKTEAKRAAELAELERDFERVKATRTAELEELEEMMRGIRGQMKATLEALIPDQSEPNPDPEGEALQRRDPDETEGLTALRPAETFAENADSDGEAPRVAGHTEFEAAS